MKKSKRRIVAYENSDFLCWYEDFKKIWKLLLKASKICRKRLNLIFFIFSLFLKCFSLEKLKLFLQILKLGSILWENNVLAKPFKLVLRMIELPDSSCLWKISISVFNSISVQNCKQNCKKNKLEFRIFFQFNSNFNQIFLKMYNSEKIYIFLSHFLLHLLQSTGKYNTIFIYIYNNF
jgi:hypothetical protein